MSFRILIVAISIISAVALTSCNTVEGLGRDAKAAGEAITGAAQKTKGY